MSPDREDLRDALSVLACFLLAALIMGAAWWKVSFLG